MMWLVTQLWWAMLIAFALGFAVSWWMLLQRTTTEVPVLAEERELNEIDIRDSVVAAEPKEKSSKKAAKKATKAKAKVGAEVPEKVAAASVPVQVKREESPREGKPTDVVQDPTKSRFGPGSMMPSLDGEVPAGFEVKADEETRRYYTKHNRDYEHVTATVWFKTEQHALEAGFHPDIEGLN